MQPSKWMQYPTISLSTPLLLPCSKPLLQGIWIIEMVSRFHFIPHLSPTRFIIYSVVIFWKRGLEKSFFSHGFHLHWQSGYLLGLVLLSASNPFLGHPNFPEHDRYASAFLVASLAAWDVLAEIWTWLPHKTHPCPNSSHPITPQLITHPLWN